MLPEFPAAQCLGSGPSQLRHYFMVVFFFNDFPPWAYGSLFLGVQSNFMPLGDPLKVVNVAKAWFRFGIKPLTSLFFSAPKDAREYQRSEWKDPEEHGLDSLWEGEHSAGEEALRLYSSGKRCHLFMFGYSVTLASVPPLVRGCCRGRWDELGGNFFKESFNDSSLPDDFTALLYSAAVNFSLCWILFGQKVLIKSL